MVIPGVAQWAVGSRSYFALDDFYLLRVAQLGGLSLHHLLAPVFQHFNPGQHLFFWVVVRFFPLHYEAALVLVLISYIGSALFFQASLDLLFGRRWATLPITFLFTSSLFWVSQFDWFASGAQSPPGTFFTLIAFYAYLRYVFGSRKGWLGLSIVAFIVALLFFMKPLLLPFYLLALRLLFLGTGEEIQPRAALRVLRKELRIWIAYAAPFALYLIGYYAHYYYPSPGKATAVHVLDFLQLAWSRSLFPGTMGFRPVQTLDASGLAIVLGAQALLAGVVYLSFRAWRGAWRAWTFLIVFFLANALMSGAPRIGQFGLGVAYEQRYFLDLAWLLPLSIALALLPIQAPSATDPAPVRRRPLPLSAAVTAIVVALLGAHSLIAWRSANQVLDAWPGTSSKAYFLHLNAGLDVLEHRAGTPNLVDYALPEYVVGSWLAPYDWASNALATLQRPLTFDDYSKPLWIPDDSGRVYRAMFQGVAGGPVMPLLGAHLLKTRGVTRNGSSFCVAPKHSGSLRLTLNPSIAGPRYFAQLDTRGSASIRTVPNLPSDASISGVAMPVIRRPRVSTWVLDTQALSSLTLIVNAKSRFCVSSITVGTFVPTGLPIGK